MVNTSSIWENYITKEHHNTLDVNESTEVLIVGGGIVGLTISHILQSSGHKCILVDRHRICGVTSVRTTAKITSQHSLIYSNLIKQHGKEKAQMYLNSNEKAIKDIETLCKVYDIDCDFTITPSFVFAHDASSIENIYRETKAVKALGLDANYHDNINIPLENFAAIEFSNQAQFNPVKYMNALVKLFLNDKGTVYESSHAKAVDYDNDRHVVHFDNGARITAEHLVIATQFPFYDGLGLYFTRLYGERSYITAIKTEDNLMDGMFISAEEPIISLRTYKDSLDKYILIGGEDHKVGANIPTTKCYNNLLKKAHQMFSVQEKIAAWSAQDYSTIDNIPYIGRLTKNYPSIYVATGFSKWGMTNSMISAMIIKGLIEDIPNPYIELYKPSRLGLERDSAKTFIIENVRVAKELISGKLKKSEDIIQLEKEQGKIINYDGKRYGAYKDGNGKVYVIDNTCTHLGCELVFNDAEKSWDCPCHASRYSFDGTVIEGVTKKALNRYDDIAQEIINQDS